MMLAIVLVAAVLVVAVPCLAAAFLVSPLACLILAAVLALTPGTCAWWFYFIDRKHAARGDALRVLDKGPQ